MSSKQFGIIFTLAGLVICVGLLSIKLNSEGLRSPEDLAAAAIEGEKNTDKEVNKETEEDFFYSAISERNRVDAEVIANLTAVVEDKNTAADVKKNAQNELLNKTKVKDSENRIEINIKNKGFKEALCYIEGDKAKIYVKGESINQEQSREIKEVVQNIAGITNLTIEVKK
ncbi:MAG: SpoIIIAH-like family protein [Clostridium sp.]|uniref:SpoIIIAH-like family protein n=1 Tax=Clostridium sp. TaxID=1506 RepID=UPI003F3088C1